MMTPFKNWKRNGYEVQEMPFDYDLHSFDVWTQDKDPQLIATITPATIEDMNEIKKDLDNGESVQGWEDGMGQAIDLRQYGIEEGDRQ